LFMEYTALPGPSLISSLISSLIHQERAGRRHQHKAARQRAPSPDRQRCQPPCRPPPLPAGWCDNSYPRSCASQTPFGWCGLAPPRTRPTPHLSDARQMHLRLSSRAPARLPRHCCTHSRLGSLRGCRGKVHGLVKATRRIQSVYVHVCSSSMSADAAGGVSCCSAHLHRGGGCICLKSRARALRQAASNRGNTASNT